MSNLILAGADQPDDHRGPDILGAVATVTSIALVTVCARVFVRLRMVHMFGLDDWMIIASMILSITGFGIVVGQVMYGAGRHAAYLDPEVNKYGLMLNFVSQPIYLWAIPLVKLSVGFFLLRIAPNKLYRRILQGTMIFLMAYTFMCFMTLMLQCQNIAVLWDSSVKTTCWATKTTLGLSYANSIVNILTDMFFAVIPIPMLWNVQINSRTKASLICIMGLGVFACAAAIVKAVYISNYGKSGDFLWDSANLTIWISTELNTGIVAACLPCLKPMFKRILDSSLRYTSSNKKDGYNLRTYGPGTGPGSKYGRSITTTQIGTRHNRSGHDLDDNLSEESILSGRNLQPHAITKTTVVVVDRTDADERPTSSGWSKRLDITPEQKIEDRL
ncbi:hypothetical protein JX265_010551 [Neoarthrinium moseri]|uniref:Rhodopsin domain-containing protein n=1 Tax=Neoarthrinium moseri TaxID=1658444 RepID=A0A9Q0AIA8_9PEZI|nr:uncharacterized protein JN550_011085 [Neoarthrinium moseri]KAI1846173.1 hypothetical protein JX266_007698 [Neoarthrinium moseri]KAI1859074.1 hypothetical protein JX265_010551 [Neoarthrinium moseri]KAI1860930.1 hypothetical protein JN550_011085 [Neoarthrinium moseri]